MQNHSSSTLLSGHSPRQCCPRWSSTPCPCSNRLRSRGISHVWMASISTQASTLPSSKHFVQATLRSLQDPTKSVTLKFSVIPKIKSSNTPQRKKTILEEPNIKDLVLAYPDLGGPLDLIICLVYRFQCVIKEPRFFPETKMAATETVFGWTITGPLGSTEPSSTPLLMAQPKDDPLQKSLERLWELDQVPDSSSLSDDDTAVVQHFQDSHNRGPDGRYIVKLPRIGNHPELSYSWAKNNSPLPAKRRDAQAQTQTMWLQRSTPRILGIGPRWRSASRSTG